ncbi:MGMT family protein [Phreatobacter oligotrophus]|uniref:MGMT family protein n=1 Tax=Phreatobacter oligotrophus TaxID=1122261 RepID=UPI0023558149|nr:MGMT family protein [Phreatobacter oligotrophus]MBX9989554.1 MGMT family protein [Phreatobacter oligotrophus]
MLDLVRQVPEGLVIEISTLAVALNIPPRHAAFICSTLSAEELELLPWYRVVPTGGRFSTTAMKRVATAEQIRRLRREGYKFASTEQLLLTDEIRWDPPDTHRETFWADDT